MDPPYPGIMRAGIFALVFAACGGGPRGSIWFDDVTAQAGLSGARSGGNTHGVGILFADLDGDGWADIFVVNGRIPSTGESLPSAFYHNNGDGTFSDATAHAGLALAGFDGYSVAAGDFDNDGHVDLAVGGMPRDRVLRNAGDGTFTDVTDAVGAGGPAGNASLVPEGRSRIVSFGDYDNDGWLDLVCASSLMPAPAAYLLRNRGNGSFTDVTAALGIRSSPVGNPCAVMWSDHDNDGDVDLWIWNDRGSHILLRNDGTQFTDITAASRLDQVTIVHPMGIDAADMDHDGDLDFYISDIGDNPLLRNNGDGTFTDVTHDTGTEGDFGWGLAFEDFDLDGWPDLFVTQEDDLPHLVFRNRGVVPVAFDAGELEHRSVRDSDAAHNVAAAFADYDHDGRVDVVVANTDGSSIILFHNVTDVKGRHWLHVAARGRPGVDNVSSIGARVTIKTGALVQFRDIEGGSSRASQNELSVRFGLGEATHVDEVRVHWPSGREAVLTNVPADQVLTVDEP
jgi:hypothetical protein